MRGIKDKVIPMPEDIDGSVLQHLLDYGQAVFESDDAVLSEGECFLLGRGRYARCTDIFPRGGAIFVHTLVLVPAGESVLLSGSEGRRDPVDGPEGAEALRCAAEVLERFEGLRHLVPDIMEYADRLEDGDA